MKAILLISHGSRSPKSRQENCDLAARLQQLSGAPISEAAFLEADRPSIPEGVERCAAAGATEILVLLNFLNSGKHVLTDIPALLEEARRRHPRIEFRVTPPIGTHPRIGELFLEWVQDASMRPQP